MAVPRQLTQIAFAAGLDESTEDEILDPTVGFPVLQNVRQDRRGGVSKRLGYAARVSTRLSGAARAAGRRIFAHNADTACVIDGSYLDVYAESLAVNVSTSRVPEVSVATVPLSASVSGASPIQHDAVVCNGVLVFVYTTEQDGAFAVAMTLDGSTLLSKTQIGGYVSDMVFQIGAIGNVAMLVHSRFSSSNLILRTLDCTSATTVALGWTNPLGSFATDKALNSSALSLQSLTNRIAIVYANASAGTNRATVKTLSATAVLETATINTASNTPDVVAVEGSIADTLWVAWNEGGVSLKAKGLDADALATTLATTATVIAHDYSVPSVGGPPSIVTSATAGAASIISTSSNGHLYYQTWTTVAGALTPGATTIDQLGSYHGSRAFLRSGRLYSLFRTGPDVALCDWTDVYTAVGSTSVRPIGYAFPRVAYVDPSSHPVTIDANRVGYVVAVLTAASVYSYRLVIYDFADAQNWRTTSHNGFTALACGVLSYFSGDITQEVGFLHAPQNVDVTNTGAGIGPTGSVSYVAVFESVDGAGNLSVSGASLPYAHTGTGFAATVKIDPLLMTARSAAQVSVYRTVASGKTYYLVGSTGALGSPVLSSISDTWTDASIISRPQLYGTGVLPGTGGAPLQRDAPPYARDVVSYQGMLVIASGSDLWWSGQTIGGEGTWFSTEQFFLTVDGPGDITALATQDGSLFVFKERSVYVLGGESPSDNGSAGGLGQPRRLAGDVGCVRASSVAVTSLGIFFQSLRGIELLSGGRASWIGEKVQRATAAYPIVTSAVLDERSSLVRFSLASAVTNGAVSGVGRDVVFDLVLGDWISVDDKFGATASQASQDACVIPINGSQRYVWLAANGVVYIEQDASYLDVATWVTMSAETGWFKASGIQGQQFLNRVLALARLHSACNIGISLGYDYSTAYAASRTWTNAETAALLSSGWPITQLEHKSDDGADGQSIRVRITDATPSTGSVGTGQGMTWLGLTLDITAKPGAIELPEGAT